MVENQKSSEKQIQVYNYMKNSPVQTGPHSAASFCSSCMDEFYRGLFSGAMLVSGKVLFCKDACVKLPPRHVLAPLPSVASKNPPATHSLDISSFQKVPRLDGLKENLSNKKFTKNEFEPGSSSRDLVWTHK